MFYESRPGVIYSDLHCANPLQINANQRTETLRKKELANHVIALICTRFACCKPAQISAGASGVSGASGVLGGKRRLGGKRSFFLVAWLPNTQPRRTPTQFGRLGLVSAKQLGGASGVLGASSVLEASGVFLGGGR